jgi:hypothetical protein
MSSKLFLPLVILAFLANAAAANVSNATPTSSRSMETRCAVSTQRMEGMEYGRMPSPKYPWLSAIGRLPSSAGQPSYVAIGAGQPLFGHAQGEKSGPYMIAALEMEGSPFLDSTPARCYPPLSLVTSSLPTAMAGFSYSVSLAANGGQPPYTWSFGQSSFPQGFSLSSNGALSGTPSTAGTYTFNVIVSDALKNNVTGLLTLTVTSNSDTPTPTPAPTTYCVANSGSDSNSGTATGANCTGTVSAWQTIAHVNAQHFSPGDSILFQDGGIWREELIPPSSGSSGSPITFGSYGSGVQPIINGSDVISSWAPATASPALQDSFGTANENDNQQLAYRGKSWIAGAFAPTASYPLVEVAVNLKLHTGAPFTSPVTAYIYNNVSGSPGASLATGIAPANVWEASVATQPNEVWINGTSLSTPQASEAALTIQNQWFWSSGILYIYSTANPSSGQTVEAATLTYPVYVNGTNYITLASLEVKNANEIDINLKNSEYDIIQGMNIHDAVGEGVYAGLGGGGHTIENSEIYNTGLGGTFGTGSGIQLNGEEAPPVTIASIVQNNYIHDVKNSVGGDHAIYDEVAGDTDRYNHFKNIVGSTAMKVDGNGILIYGNLFDSIPSGGIWIDAFSNVKVYNNTFYNVGTVSPYAAVSFTGDGAESGVSVENNIDYFPGSSYSVFLNINTNATGFSSHYNDAFGVWWAEWINGSSYDSLASWTKATGQDAHSITGNPLFANASASQFWLATGSPAIGAGVYIPGVSTSNPPNIGAR